MNTDTISTRLRVKELLRERRWTTKVLAEKTGMSESYLTHIKNGTRRWNEDALKKLAIAFDLSDPSELLDSFQAKNSALMPTISLPTDFNAASVKVNIVPILGEIPEQPSAYNNHLVQQQTGFKDQFLPVIGEDDSAMFCLCVQDNSMAPNFVKGDYLIVSPASWSSSGDIVAVEYTKDEKKRVIAQINFMDDFVVLESVNHKKAPLALVRGKDQFRILGKVIGKYQKL